MTGAGGEEVPETRYAKSGELFLGYQVWGEGPLDVLEMNNGANFSIDATVDEPHWLRYKRRLASFCRLVRYDARGIGLSDSDHGATSYSFDPWVDDALAVLDAEASSVPPSSPESWADSPPWPWPPTIPSGYAR